MKTRSHFKKGGSKTRKTSSSNNSIPSVKTSSSNKSMSSVKAVASPPKTIKPKPNFIIEEINLDDAIEIIPKKKTKKYTPKLKKNTKNIKFIIDSASTEIISDKYSEQLIVTTFLQMLNTVKLYHWKTTSYPEHKATDELYSNLNKNIDSFVEVMLGKTGSRVNLTGQKTLPLLDYTNLEDFKKEIEKYKVFLINMNKDAGINITNNSDLLNIRDELLANLNQFTYLLTFK